MHKKKFNQTDQAGENFINKIIGNHAGKKILDYGCGGGEISIRHMNMGAKFVLGVDISKKLLEKALKRTIAQKNIEFMSIDSKNYVFENLISNNFFNHIVSYYVFCTIESFSLIKSIVNSFYKKLKVGGKALLLMPNRDNFNGKQSFGFSFIKEPNLKDGKTVTTYLRTNNTELPLTKEEKTSHLKITDVFWSQKTLKKIFEKCGFKTKIHEIYVDKGEYKGIIHENKYSPMYVLEATK